MLRFESARSPEERSAALDAPSLPSSSPAAPPTGLDCSVSDIGACVDSGATLFDSTFCRFWPLPLFFFLLAADLLLLVAELSSSFFSEAATAELAALDALLAALDALLPVVLPAAGVRGVRGGCRRRGAELEPGRRFILKSRSRRRFERRLRGRQVVGRWRVANRRSGGVRGSTARSDRGGRRLLRAHWPRAARSEMHKQRTKR